MKKIFTLKKIIIACSAIIAVIVGSIFLILYSSQFVDEQAEQIEPSKQNAIVITSKNLGSYGELMFAYIGENNYIYNLDDESKPLIEQPASLLLYASDDTVIYTASVEIDASHYGRESMIQELQIGENENVVNTVAIVSVDPCWSSNDEVVYFTREENRKQLCTFEPLTSTVEVAAEFEEEITGLRISSDGLLVTTASGIEMLYVPLSKQLTETNYNCQGSRIIVCEQYDLILSPSGSLYYRWMGSNDAVKVSDNVTVTAGYQDNEILYVQKGQEGLSLNAYFVSEEQTKTLVQLPDNILPQLTVSADYAFIIADNNIVSRINLDSAEMIPFCQIDSDCTSPLISIFDYRLMVYDFSGEIDSSYRYSLDATATPSETEIMELSKLQGETTLEINPEYANYITLEMASIGTDVVNLQSKLFDLGYLQIEPSGIFDYGTHIAVQYLQNDLGIDATGIVSPELQYRLYNEELPKYQGYEALSLTSKGIRVRDLQSRLRTLKYMTEAISGEIDEKTKNGLTLYSEQNGFSYSGGVISTDILNGLFDTESTSFHGYISPEKGDCCIAVSELNERLKELHYLVGSVNPIYDAKTQNAIELFQKVNAIEKTDSIDDATITLLYSEDAKLCPDDVAPKTISDSTSSNENQVISDRQLKILRKWLTKQFAVNHTDKQAVKRLQMQLVKLGFLDKEKVSMIYDQATMDAVSLFQSSINITSDGIPSKKVLTEIFNMNIKMPDED